MSDSETPKPAEGTSGSPAEFLKNVVGKHVKVRIASGIDYQGTLSCLDGYMNVAMENTQEIVDGQVKNSFGDAFIRGNNGEPYMYLVLKKGAPLIIVYIAVLYISAEEEV